MEKNTATFTFPGKYTAEKPATEKDKVTLRELSVEEQIQTASKFDGVRMLHEFYKRSLVQVRGVKCDGRNRDQVWADLGPKQRDLVASGYRFLHVAEDDSREGFLASAELAVTE